MCLRCVSDTSLIGRATSTKEERRKNLVKGIEREGGGEGGRNCDNHAPSKHTHLQRDKFVTFPTSDFEISNTYVTTCAVCTF